MKADSVKIFDTTLRDGEQSPGCSMNLEEKVGPGAQAPVAGCRYYRSRVSDRLRGRFCRSPGSRLPNVAR
jgi:hypothetical protein